MGRRPGEFINAYKILERFRLARAQRPPPAEPPGDVAGGDVPDTATHHGMGSRHYPISKQAWARTLALHAGSRGGLALSSEEMLQEIDLVVPSTRLTLQLQPEARNCCMRQHRGFCKVRDLDVHARYSCVLAHIQRWEKEAHVGKLILRFVSLESTCTANFHASFANFRNKPRYTAMWLKCVPVPDEGHEGLPCWFKEELVNRDVICIPNAIDFERGDVPHYTGWALALALVRRYDACISMERLIWDATSIPGMVWVHDFEQLVGDITQPLDTGPNGAKLVPRPIRAGAALVGPRHPRPRGEGPVDRPPTGQKRRTRARNVLDLITGRRQALPPKPPWRPWRAR